MNFIDSSELLKALIIGIIQGLTEYLPVSSSGHIELSKTLLQYDPEAGSHASFSVILHLGTVLSTLVVFRKDIWAIIRGLFQPKDNAEAWPFAFKVILSMMPATIIALLYEKEIDVLFLGNLTLVGTALLFTSALLFFAQFSKPKDRVLGPVEALLIGMAQAVALLPGISRSGATIATALLLGLNRAEAARFSFLMVIPLILGKVAKDVLSGDLSKISSEQHLPFFVGFLASFVVGVLACQLMLNLVKRGQFWHFGLYCALVGLVALVYAYGLV